MDVYGYPFTFKGFLFARHGPALGYRLFVSFFLANTVIGSCAKKVTNMSMAYVIISSEVDVMS